MPTFRIKGTIGSETGVICTAKCCIKDDKQVAFHDLNLETVYAPAVGMNLYEYSLQNRPLKILSWKVPIQLMRTSTGI